MTRYQRLIDRRNFWKRKLRQAKLGVASATTDHAMVTQMNRVANARQKLKYCEAQLAYSLGTY